MNKKIVHSVFEHTAGHFPDHIAVEDQQNKLSYSKLNEISNELAHLILSFKKGPEPAILSLLPSGSAHIISMLASFKTGAVFVPQSEQASTDFLQRVIEETKAGIAIVDVTLNQVERMQMEMGMGLDLSKHISDKLDKLGDQLTHAIAIPSPELVIPFQKNGRGWVQVSGGISNENANHDPMLGVDPAATNYVFFTSGSTGNAKAIVGKHISLAHYTSWHREAFNFTEGTRIAQLASPTFDASLKDIFPALTAGATLCIPPAATRENTVKLQKWLLDNRINIVQTVPSFLRVILRDIRKKKKGVAIAKHLKQLVLSGEMLYGKDLNLIKDILGNQVKVANLYGLTETTILKTCQHLDLNDSFEDNAVIPVGQPISNTMVIIAKGKRLANPGETGEVYIKTPFLSKGYLNNEALNKRAFVQNPVITDKEDIVFKTGDFGKYLEDRSILLQGRIDDIVKVNGIRAELKDIEAHLLNMEGLAEAAVLSHKNKENQTELIAYYSPASLERAELRKHLTEQLPGALIPSYFVGLEAFPLNINGKVDRKALPLPEQLAESDEAYEKATDQVEVQLTKIYQELLGPQRLGVNHSFFDYGGNSLKAIQLISLVEQTFEVEVRLVDVFQHPTIKQLSTFIKGAEKTRFEPIPVIPEADSYPVSDGQMRHWLMQQMDAAPFTQNLPAYFKVTGSLNLEALQKAVNLVFERHQSLRTVFRIIDAAPRQVVLPLEKLDIQIKEQSFSSAENIQDLATREVKQAFALDAGPLMRMTYLTSESAQYLFITVHHILMDEWSMEVFVREVLQAYTSMTKGLTPELPKVPVQYKDHVSWFKDRLASKEETDRDYWNKQYDDKPTILKLPFSVGQPTKNSFEGAFIEKHIDQGAVAAFEGLGGKHNASLFITLLSAYKVLLQRYSGDRDIIVGSPIANRNHTDLNDQIGHYINTIAYRSKISGSNTFSEVLDIVKTAVMEGMEHGEYPFDRIVDQVRKKHQQTKPLFNTGFTWHIAPELNTLVPQGLSFDPLDMDFQVADTPLWLHAIHGKEGIRLRLVYNTALFETATIEAMIGHLASIVQEVTAAPDKQVAQLMSDSQKTQKNPGLAIDLNL